MSNTLTWISNDPGNAHCRFRYIAANPAESHAIELTATATPLVKKSEISTAKIFGLPAPMPRCELRTVNLSLGQWDVDTTGRETEISLPSQALNCYTYRGKHLQIEPRLSVLANKQVMATLPLTRDKVKPKAPPLSSDLKLLEHPDSRNLFTNLKYIDDAQFKQVVFMLLGYLALWPAMIMGFVFLRNSFTPETATRIMFLPFIGLIWWVPKMLSKHIHTAMKSFVALTPQPLPTLTADSQVRISELFTGTNYRPLDTLTLRLVAVQTERYCIGIEKPSRTYTSSSSSSAAPLPASYHHESLREQFPGSMLVGEFEGKYRITYLELAYQKPVKACLLYEKTATHIPAHTELHKLFEDPIPMRDFFDSFPPPCDINPHWGVDIRWHLQLIHPVLVDQELVLEKLQFKRHDFRQDA